MARTLSLILLVACALCADCRFVNDMLAYDQDAEDLQTILRIIQKPRELERYKFYGVNDDLPILGFSWKDCGKPTDTFKFKSLNLNPDPIRLPGNVSVGVTYEVTEDVTAPLTVKMEIEKKVFGSYMRVPCVDNMGSCTYKDVCSLIPFKPDNCPPPLNKYKLPCTCPFKKGTYTLPLTSLLIDPTSMGIPASLTKGDYKARILATHGSTQVGCYEFEASVAKKK